MWSHLLLCLQGRKARGSCSCSFPPKCLNITSSKTYINGPVLFHGCLESWENQHLVLEFLERLIQTGRGKNWHFQISCYPLLLFPQDFMQAGYHGEFCTFSGRRMDELTSGCHTAGVIGCLLYRWWQGPWLLGMIKTNAIFVFLYRRWCIWLKTILWLAA